MTHLTYAEAGFVGLMQGITELFPVSSLGHAVLIPALVGGQWAQDLDVSRAESPYLAFIVGLHVATAAAMILFFWRDWVRIIGAFFGSLRHAPSPQAGRRRRDAAGRLRSADGGRAAEGHRRRGRPSSDRRRQALLRAAGAEAGA